ncbi:hypothetical protein Sru01_18330 [Sphaerisporangium rufum]|uniref:Alpha/beta hydrolase fold n=1 Tax=Sphaerisporangium rufum TaxID=1381558 RepID=A0A919QZA4_9ACTN|nr:alpha/beta fold hydrolase [Sphaerisporangium rufum]GII76851.1 hypothetical protein Sru01_18330 [Sphaerisporangium rufum]
MDHAHLVTAAVLAAGVLAPAATPVTAAPVSAVPMAAAPVTAPSVAARAAATAVMAPARTAPGCGAGAVCGTVQVPLDHARPAAGTTTVAYMLVLRRDTAHPAAGTLALNPGGPGIPAIGRRDYAADYPELTRTHDLLLVDPRGVGRSSALTCRSAGWSDLSRTRTEAVAAAGACGRELGSLRRYYTTAATADDLDAVRARLGIDRLDLIGRSYGAYLMTVYAERHPRHVRSLILSSAYPVEFDMLGRPAAFAMRRALRLLCARSGGACDGGQVMADLSATADRLARHPVRYSGGHLLDETALAGTVYKLASSHVALFGRLPQALGAAAAGDLVPLAGLAARVRPLSGPDLRGARGGPGFSMPIYTTVTCNDYPVLWDRAAPLAERVRRYRARVARLDPHDFRPFRPAAWLGGILDLGDFCVSWPDRRAPARYGDGRLPDVPVLVLSGELDLSTPTEEALEVAARFRSARVVEVPSAGHVPEKDPRAAACVLGIENRFVRDHRLTGTACLRRIPPVPVPSPADQR